MAGTGHLAVLGVAEAEAAWPGFDAVISVEDLDAGRTLRIPPGATAQLVQRFEDLDFDDGVTTVASPGQVSEALAFARDHAGGRLLIHCHQGQCRSAALALGVLSERLGPGHEAEAVAELLRLRPQAGPNLLVLGLVDSALGRDGALHDAWMAHEATDERLARMRFLRQAAYESFGPQK